tara:strand:- start:93 stop:629 length:537 start_codon:yes stop_codon:yes gene_type:complete
MVNYELGKIYTIRSSETVGVYIGSTCQPLAVRFGGHKTDYKINKNLSISNIFNYGIENSYIELLEKYPCNSREELHKREGEQMRLMDNCINLVKPRIDCKTDDYCMCKVCNISIQKISMINHKRSLIHKTNINNTDKYYCNYCNVLFNREGSHETSKNHLKIVKDSKTNWQGVGIGTN